MLADPRHPVSFFIGYRNCEHPCALYLAICSPLNTWGAWAFTGSNIYEVILQQRARVNL